MERELDNREVANTADPASLELRSGPRQQRLTSLHRSHRASIADPVAPERRESRLRRRPGRCNKLTVCMQICAVQICESEAVKIEIESL